MWLLQQGTVQQTPTQSKKYLLKVFPGGATSGWPAGGRSAIDRALAHHQESRGSNIIRVNPIEYRKTT